MNPEIEKAYQDFINARQSGEPEEEAFTRITLGLLAALAMALRPKSLLSPAAHVQDPNAKNVLDLIQDEDERKAFQEFLEFHSK